MPTNQPGSRSIDIRTEILDEPTGTIEFGPREPRHETGEDYKPASSSYLGGHEKNAVRKAEERQRARGTGRRGGFWRGVWNRMRQGLGGRAV
ncbi:MAG TPA: hypothetical protein VF881_00355 [Polyangiaceae bacterium]